MREWLGPRSAYAWDCKIRAASASASSVPTMTTMSPTWSTSSGRAANDVAVAQQCHDRGPGAHLGICHGASGKSGTLANQNLVRADPRNGFLLGGELGNEFSGSQQLAEACSFLGGEGNGGRAGIGIVRAGEDQLGAPSRCVTTPTRRLMPSCSSLRTQFREEASF